MQTFFSRQCVSVCLPTVERGGEYQTENDTETIDTRPFKICFGSTHGDMTLGRQLPERKRRRLRRLVWDRTLPGATAQGTVVVENTALMDHSTQAWTVVLYRPSDLKYSSQLSHLSINIYFNKCYTESACSALGMHVTFAVEDSFGFKMAIKMKVTLHSLGSIIYTHRHVSPSVFMWLSCSDVALERLNGRSSWKCIWQLVWYLHSHIMFNARSVLWSLVSTTSYLHESMFKKHVLSSSDWSALTGHESVSPLPSGCCGTSFQGSLCIVQWSEHFQSLTLCTEL